MKRLNNLIVRGRAVRRIGSAAMDLCYVAAGRFAGYWEQDLKPWDTAAGALLVEEAGGRVTDFEGNRFTPFLKTVAASNSLIHDDLLAALRPLRPFTIKTAFQPVERRVPGRYSLTSRNISLPPRRRPRILPWLR